MKVAASDWQSKDRVEQALASVNGLKLVKAWRDDEQNSSDSSLRMAFIFVYARCQATTMTSGEFTNSIAAFLALQAIMKFG